MRTAVPNQRQAQTNDVVEIDLVELLLKYLTDIRPGRTFPRKVRSRRFESLTNRI